jgi:glycosidase
MMIEELVLIWLQNQNPAYRPINDLINDQDLAYSNSYKVSIRHIDEFFDQEPPFGPENEPLFKLLMRPILAAPTSLMDQIKYIFHHWGDLLKDTRLFKELTLATEFIKEEDQYLFMKAQAEADRLRSPNVRQAGFEGGFEKSTPPIPTFAEGFLEGPERFSEDLNWMPRVILLAKSTFVWLDQLSKKFGRHIHRLDHIPDEELDTIARRGFTGLWLIGIWERSKASKKIKHINGNIDAVASAYSLQNYEIADELGGYPAYENLRDRARKRGVRLASDMVPNHTGIDSDWVINHPDWFIQKDHPPFHGYKYTGPDLSDDDRVAIFLEDGYWSKSDAAVTFKRVDRWTGQERYLYHGNDGTFMPWNDTAQLDFLNPELREAVIQQILHVARHFPIIRFDAAMVLAKQHIQRLWYPRHGTTGAIPSRWTTSMTQEEFDAAIPEEFWREVVDRIHKEVPNTLLLAEAFWMLEGYFVRTLGMHRVYNSAFMHMFMKEENASYRYLIKNTLEYNPQILKRYVNFMNNPDEETAVEQFGKGDKYFGVCIMMCTLPGLPMFGHGQVEGFNEKYGMEYKRAYYEELPDEHLVARHEREVFPILKKRYLFAEVENYFLYDFYTESGHVDENVFAFSNKYGDERSLVIYHNKFGHTTGWIRTSVGYLSDGKIIQKSLSEGLGLSGDPNTYTIFRDHISGLEFIRHNKEIAERGIFSDLHAYKYHVFLDFKQVKPTKIKPYDQLHDMLNGGGVPSMSEAVLELSLQTVHTAIRDMLEIENFSKLKNGWYNGKVKKAASTLFKTNIKKVLNAIQQVEPEQKIDVTVLSGQAEKDYHALIELSYKYASAGKKLKDWQTLIAKDVPSDAMPEHRGWRLMLSWMHFRHLNEVCSESHETDFNILRDWHLEKFIFQLFVHLDASEADAEHDILLLRCFMEAQRLLDKGGDPLDVISMLHHLIENKEIQQYILVNYWDEKFYYNKELFEDVLRWVFVISAVDAVKLCNKKDIEAQIISLYTAVEGVQNVAASTGYDLEKLLNWFNTTAEHHPNLEVKSRKATQKKAGSTSKEKVSNKSKKSSAPKSEKKKR